MANQFRNYCLTINNPFIFHIESLPDVADYKFVTSNIWYDVYIHTYTDKKTQEQKVREVHFYKDSDSFNTYLQQLDHIKYFCFQFEKGDEKEVEHIQLYIEFEVGKRFDTMKKLFPRAHIESRKGSKEQARDYCRKADTRIGEVYEFGEFNEVGERSDINDIIEMVRSGYSNTEIMSTFPKQYFMYNKHINTVRQTLLEEKYSRVFRKLDVTYIWGAPGVGKSRYVMEKYNYDCCRVSNFGRGAFDSYSGHDVIIFEEYSPNHCFAINNMLFYLDGYPLRLPCRYNDKVACYTKVYIISNLPLNKQYPIVQSEQPFVWEAFKRRINSVYQMNDKGELIEDFYGLPLVKGDDSQLPF